MNHFGIPRKPLETHTGALNQDNSKHQQIDKKLQKCKKYLEELEQDLKRRPANQAPALKSDILDTLDEYAKDLKAFIPDATRDQERIMQTTQQKISTLKHDLESRIAEYLD